ncbi:HD domain-containing phosphohydrolase [Chloroflexota bacterium]
MVNQIKTDIECVQEPLSTDARLKLINLISRKIGSVSEMSTLVKHITQMTQNSLKASASSVLLLDEKNEELYFEVAEGEASDTLKKIKLDPKSGIAGWVLQHCKPLIINNVTGDKRFNGQVDKTTGFVTKSIIAIPMIVHRKTIGVIEVLNKLDGSDFNNEDLEILLSVASTAAMAIENTRLQQEVQDGYKSTISALAATVDAKDPYTCGHSKRVKEYALLGGIQLSLPKNELGVLEYGGILHDIGKIGISDIILRQPGPLNSQELVIMREHPMIGFRILEDIPFLEEASKLVLHHHERYDGKGYPRGLKGLDIPLGARLIAIADSFDTMTTQRSYRAALGEQYAIDELNKCSGTQFCPVAVDAFLSGYQMQSGKI